ncbi:unnamed protein product [Caenorhabditis angaria]|uniref:Serpentine Receptor, class H n=1 Tax=Caenorhabditis angaria TaxID=860376 RepID=A0A9P1IVN8_9PELO|nr:unnamed protein product [Caenorhabditis angaria]
MSLVEQYHKINYSINCDNTWSYLATPSFFENACHIGTFFMLVLSSYALFLMLKVSPSTMKATVPYMVHLHIWTMTCDFMFAVMVCPYYFLPLVAARPLGILIYFGVPFVVQIWLAFAALGGMTCAIVTLFEQRHRLIVTSSKFVMRRRSTRIIFNFILYGYHINFGVPEIVTLPDNQQELKYQFLKTYPCPPEIYFDDEMFALQKDGSLFNPHMYFTCFSITLICSFFVLHTFITLLPGRNPNMSAATRKLQRSFFFSMCIQVSIPVCVILAPNIYWNLSITFQFYFQEGNNLSVICFTLHGVSASMATIFLYKPYRKYTWNLFLSVIFMKKIQVSTESTRAFINTGVSGNSIHHR